MIGTNLPDLLPCPFCGSNGACLTHRAGLLFWNVECAGCHARGPERIASATCEADRINAVHNAKRSAIEGWNCNRRTPEIMRAWMAREEARTDA